MCNNILVIGNGFDLYHELKTSYSDFIEFCKELIKDKKGTKGRNWVVSNSFIRCFIEVASETQGWIDCEKEIEIIVTIILKILYDKNVFNNELLKRNIIETTRTSLASYEFERLILMKKFCDSVHSDSKKSEYALMQDRYFKKYQGIDRSLVMKTLVDDLNDFIKIFKYYLEKNVINQTITKTSNQIKNIAPSYVINFNYTNTYERYGIKRKDVCYIHGSVQDNNIVLGIRDFDEQNLDSIYFKKFFQRIQKHTDIIDWSRFEIKSSTDKPITYFFGHSLSNTDGDIIREIYNKSYKVIVFYLKNTQNKDYEQKVINLVNTLGRDEVIQGIYSGRIEFKSIK